MEDQTELRFTDSVEKPEHSSIEVTARVLNINAGHNAELMEASRNLSEYAELIRRLKEAVNGLRTDSEIRAAVIRVVDQCIEDRILRDILMQNKSEVIEMFMTEYDEKETMRRLARDEREEGRREGREEGREEGRKEGREEGREEGRREGHDENRAMMKKATEYLVSSGRESEVVNLNLDDQFFASVLEEAGISYAENE